MRGLAHAEGGRALLLTLLRRLLLLLACVRVRASPAVLLVAQLLALEGQSSIEARRGRRRRRRRRRFIANVGLELTEIALELKLAARYTRVEWKL